MVFAKEHEEFKNADIYLASVEEDKDSKKKSCLPLLEDIVVEFHILL